MFHTLTDLFPYRASLERSTVTISLYNADVYIIRVIILVLHNRW